MAEGAGGVVEGDHKICCRSNARALVGDGLLAMLRGERVGTDVAEQPTCIVAGAAGTSRERAFGTGVIWSKVHVLQENWIGEWFCIGGGEQQISTATCKGDPGLFACDEFFNGLTGVAEDKHGLNPVEASAARGAGDEPMENGVDGVETRLSTSTGGVTATSGVENKFALDPRRCSSLFSGELLLTVPYAAVAGEEAGTESVSG